MHKTHWPHRLSPLTYWCVFVFMCLCVYVFVFPQTVHAQTIDPRCWARDSCVEARKTQKFHGAEKPEDGFIQDNETKEACGDKEGFCLPATQSKTTISFGGQTQFLHLGDFIKYMYRYAIIVAGVLAVIMIIVAGFQWTASGGNSETIISAKKRITNAIIGLLLVVFSYTILNTLNPALVNLRLPQVWLINAARLTKEGDPCRTAGPKLKECQDLGAPGEYVCRPYTKPGTCVTLVQEEMVFLATLPLDLATGGIGSKLGGQLLSKGGTFLKETATQGAKKYATYFFKTPWQNVAKEYSVLRTAFTKSGAAQAGEQLAFSFVKEEVKKDVSRTGAALAFSKAVAGTIIKNTAGVAVAGGTVLTGLGGYGVSAEIYDLLNSGEPGLAGVCQKSFKFKEGDLCNLNAPGDCASGKCVDTGIGLSCWVEGVNLGTCSTGANKSFCKVPADCQTGLRCVQTTVAGFDLSECTNGTDNAPCNTDSDCPGGTCPYSENLKRKVCRVNIEEGAEGSKCILDSQCNYKEAYYLFCQEEKTNPQYKHPGECVRGCIIQDGNNACTGLYKTCVHHTSPHRYQGYEIYDYCE